MATLALIPLRHGKRLLSPDISSLPKEKDPADHSQQQRKNFLPPNPTTTPQCSCLPLASCSSDSSTLILGRRELLTCLWKACGCDDDITTSRHKCDDCQRVNQWALSALSRHMLRFQVVANDSDQPTVHLWIRGENAKLLLDIQPKPPASPAEMASDQVDNPDWFGPWTLSPHSKLNFRSLPVVAKREDATSTESNVVDADLSFELVRIDLQTKMHDYDLSSSCITTKNRAPTRKMPPASNLLKPQFLATMTEAENNTRATANAEEPQTAAKSNRHVAEEAELDNAAFPSPSAPLASKHLESNLNMNLDASMESFISSVPSVSELPPSSELLPSTNHQLEASSILHEDGGESTQDHQHDNRESQESNKTISAEDFSLRQTQLPSPPAVKANETSSFASSSINNGETTCNTLSLTEAPEKARDHEPSNFKTISPTEKVEEDRAAIVASNNQPCNDPEVRYEAKLSVGQATESLGPVKHIPPYSVVKIGQEVTTLSSSNSFVMCQPRGNDRYQKSELALGAHRLSSLPYEAHKASPRQQQPVLYFVRRGGLSEKRIHLLSTNARGKGAFILDHLSADRAGSDPNGSITPTHLVLEPSTSVSAFLAELQFSNQDSLREWLDQNKIQCVTTAWITKGESLEEPPPPVARWYKLNLFKRPNNFNDQVDDSHQEHHNESRKRTRSGSRPMTPSFDDDGLIAGDDGPKVSHSPKGRNAELSELFLKLSKLHQSCPLFPEDTWKAYSFHVTAGRLRHLEFEITDDPALLTKIRQIRGFGDSTLRMIQEFLSTGTFQRIDAFEADRDRIAMKRMMAIWGVGRVKLVRQGYKDISQVRKGLESRKLEMDRNQRIGVECYEDILEEMDRPEVEMIGSIVAAAAQEVLPGVETMIMGSYRRGKPACGDVDVFLTHKDHFERTPPTVLGTIVDKLRQWGHIAFHLTHLIGMKSSDDLGKRHWSSKPPEKDISTYFGVFHSPVVNGKRRRVDIKFFPYRERIFATLYFTGNGFFNRSMRLWASRKFKLLLNEKGLFTRDLSSRVMEADTERQVFDHLHLIYKQPHERDCFDAVQPVDQSDDAQLAIVSLAEINNDESEHRWID